MPVLQAKNNKSYLFILLSLFVYLSFGYFTQRTGFYLVFIQYVLLFACFLGIYTFEKENVRFLKTVSFLFRAILLFSIPNLSNDFYRFIWDGRLIWEGFNPYLSLPEVWVSTQPDVIANAKELYLGMGEMNGSNYTCYPPINQLCFVIPAMFFSKNILGSAFIMRLLIVFADLGTLWFGEKILKKLNLSASLIYLYILNPFIILELTGNLHFEGVMIFFFVGSLYFLFIRYWKCSALFLALSVCVKAIPLLFLPIFFRQLSFKQFVGFGLMTVGITALLFTPFISTELINNFMQSINLYFQNFEFNASIYYIIREIGYQNVGYNIIQTVGKITPLIIITFVGIMGLLKHNKNIQFFLHTLLFSISFYYFLSTTVHPWYIALPLILSVFTPHFKYPLVWSFMMIFSYSAYITPEYHENLWLVSFEYLVVYAVLIWDFKTLRKQQLYLI